jgi:lysophospholipase L1-like esterase
MKHSFLALGDSYTIGEAVEPAERWPHQLCALAAEEGISLALPHIIATTGWTTDELQKAIDEARLQPPYDWVSLLIGVNNQYRGYSTETYRLEFSALLNQAIQFAGNRAHRVVVLSIPDWGMTPFAEGRDRAAISRDIDEFNRLNREATEDRGVAYVDITPHSRLHAVDMVAHDGLHPSGAMYRYWAGEVLPVLRAKLRL